MANNIYTSDENLTKAVSNWPNLHVIYGGCKFLAGLGDDGNVHYTTDTYSYLLPWEWENIRALAMDKQHNAVFFGLKNDGTCMITKKPFAGNSSYDRDFSATRLRNGNDGFSILHEKVHSLGDIVQIAVDGTVLWALDKDGNVHGVPYGRQFWLYYGWDPHEFHNSIDTKLQTSESWRCVRKILIAQDDILIAQKENGELVYAGHTGDLFGTFGERAFRKMQDHELIDACSFYGGESAYFAFLDSDHTLHCERLCKTKEQKFSQIIGLDHSFIGLTDEGTIVQFQGIPMNISHWPGMKQISIGRKCQHNYDNLYLVGIAAD